ncbi:MAG: hypothetical protein R3B70_22775 [Polyangiaceae bacterium]
MLLGALILGAPVLGAFSGVDAARAETSPPRVLVVPAGAGDPVAARLIDELIAAGVTVEVTLAPSEPLPSLARARGARAVVKVEASRRAVRLWTAGAPPTSTGTVLTETAADAGSAARSLALRTVEVLRPSLAPTAASSASASASAATSATAGATAGAAAGSTTASAPSTPSASNDAGTDPSDASAGPAGASSTGLGAPGIAPTAGAPFDTGAPPSGAAGGSSAAPITGDAPGAPPPRGTSRPSDKGGPPDVMTSPTWPPAPSAAAPPDTLAIYMAPAILLRPTTPLSPSAGGLWGFTRMLTPYFGLDLCALVPVVPGAVTTSAGTVKIASGAVGGAALFRFPARPATLSVWAGLGLAAGFVGYDAEVTAGGVRASDGMVAHALPNARAAIEWRISPWLGVRADLLAAIARPRPVLEIAGEGDIALEEPLVALATGVVVWLP